MTELDRLLYIELPNLINRIIKISTVPPAPANYSKKVADEIKKVSITEVDSAIETYKKLSAKRLSD